MIQTPEDRRPPLTPQLALRVAVVGSVALAMFAIIFFRLWFLQVLSGDQYVAQAANNQVRNLRVAAQRGEIRDRNGNLLVDSKPSIAVVLTPGDLPKNPRRLRRLYGRLAKVLGTSTKRKRCSAAGEGVFRLAEIQCAVKQQEALLPYADVTIATDVPPQVQYYLAERQDQFPGVSVQQVWLRRYPLGSVAAQLFGTVGRITQQEVRDSHFRGASPNSIVGQSGLEYYYDKYLRGTDGSQKVQVDALGRYKGTESGGREPIPGNTLKLSLDLPLQRAGQAALEEAIANNPPAPAGAFVALNPVSGEVYAMGSSPTFNPNIFTKPLTQSEYQQINNASSGYPLFNRAIQSAYPTGSTFKGITSIAALESGAWSLGDTYDDTGQFQDAPGVFRHNAGHASYGVLDITQAIMVSSDDFFYNLGRRLNVDPVAHPKGGALQQWATQLGIGRKTGIDLGGETSGILPSPEWRAHRNTLEAQCDAAVGQFRYTDGRNYSSRKAAGWHHSPKHSPGGCGIADGTNRPWSAGDNENLAVGQGDLEATPLQLAVAYSSIENGGNIVRPHVGLEIDAPDGSVVQKINPPAARHVSIQQPYLDAVRSGLHDAASVSGGTSADVFAGWNQGQYPVYGKTGTAQRGILADQSWYVCYVPDPVRPILVVVTVEQGGFGAQAAAPAAREILSQWFYGRRGKFIVGASKTL
jgi:penicillin-binding protein 2